LDELDGDGACGVFLDSRAARVAIEDDCTGTRLHVRAGVATSCEPPASKRRNRRARHADHPDQYRLSRVHAPGTAPRATGLEGGRSAQPPSGCQRSIPGWSHFEAGAPPRRDYRLRHAGQVSLRSRRPRAGCAPATHTARQGRRTFFERCRVGCRPLSLQRGPADPGSSIAVTPIEASLSHFSP
jgi:hypothetical protein